jgi:hypothetical protein
MTPAAIDRLVHHATIFEMNAINADILPPRARGFAREGNFPYANCARAR